MNAETLKASLIYSLNLGTADDFLENICECLNSLDSNPEKTADATTEMLFAARKLLIEYQYAMRRLALLQRETDELNRIEEARRSRDGRYTDEEGDTECLENRRYPVRRSA